MFRARAVGWGVLLIAGAWLVLFCAGHPLPFVDDLFFIGSAINFAQGHGYFNPYCPSMGLLDPRPEFFLYMPLHGYVLAGWIKVFGLSWDSLAAFQCVMAALATLGLWQATRRVSDSLLLPLGLVACVEIFLNSAGQRPESLGLALLVWSWVLLETDSLVAWIFGGLFLVGSVFTSPNIGVLAPEVAIWAVIRSVRKPNRARTMQDFGALGAGGALAFLLFLFAIHFELARFIEIFNIARHRSVAFQNPGLFDALGASPILWRDAIKSLVQVFEPLGIVLLAIGVVYFRRDLFKIQPSLATLGFVLVGALFMVVPALSSAQGHPPLAFYGIVTCLVVVANVTAPLRPFAGGIWTVLFLVFLLSIGHRSLQLLCRPHLPVAQAETIRQSVGQSSAPLYVDEFALATVFDYNLPDNAFDYHFGLTDRFGSFDPRDFPERSKLVVSKETIVRAKAWERFDLGPTPPLMPLIGPLFPVKLANPFDIVVIPGGH